MAASDDAWLVFNVGDSRCYSLTRGVLAQLTVDHSEVQELVDQGVISPAQARVHPQRNVITRAVGQVPAPLVDVQRVPRGGRFLLTTDGLPSEVDDATIAAICAQHEDATELAEALIAAAEAAGGRDNITVIIVDDHLLGSRGTTTSNTVPRELIIREVAQ